MSTENDTGADETVVTPTDEQAQIDKETAAFTTPDQTQRIWDKDRDVALGNTPAPEAEDPDAAAADAGDDAADAGEGDEKAKPGTDVAAADDTPKDIPVWLKKRVERVGAKDEAVTRREADIVAKEAALAAREAAIEAKAQAAELVAPDPDDYTSDAAYQRAVKSHNEAADRIAERVKVAPKKDEPAERPVTVLGLTTADITAGVSRIQSAVPESVATKLGDTAFVPKLPAAVLVEIADQPTKEATEAMARFVIGNKATMAAIAELRPHQQAAAFVRAFNEKPPASARRQSSASEPIEAVNGRSAAVPNLSNMNFGDYEALMNKQEREERGR